jgi:hypothetical protein
VWKALELIAIDRANGMLRSLFGGASGSIFPPIAPGRAALPSDVAPEVFRRFRSTESSTAEENPLEGWVTWAELVAIDWEKPEVIGYEGYIRAKRGELIPDPGHTDWPKRERLQSVQRRRERRDEALDQLGGWPDGADDVEVDGVIYRRVLRSRGEAMTEDWRLLFAKMEKLATQYGPDGVRLIVWTVA